MASRKLEEKDIRPDNLIGVKKVLPDVMRTRCVLFSIIGPQCPLTHSPGHTESWREKKDGIFVSTVLIHHFFPISGSEHSTLKNHALLFTPMTFIKSYSHDSLKIQLKM